MQELTEYLHSETQNRSALAEVTNAPVAEYAF